MKCEHDETIDPHYKDGAKEHGLSSTSTISDEIAQAQETHAISQFVGESLRLRQAEGSNDPATIMNVGCGNGYTLEKLVSQYPNQRYVGIEKSHELRRSALSRFHGNERVEIFEGDIRDRDFAKGNTADILICQRVIINLLNIEDQKHALNNIVAIVKSPIVRRK